MKLIELLQQSGSSKKWEW